MIEPKSIHERQRAHDAPAQEWSEPSPTTAASSTPGKKFAKDQGSYTEKRKSLRPDPPVAASNQSGQDSDTDDQYEIPHPYAQKRKLPAYFPRENREEQMMQNSNGTMRRTGLVSPSSHLPTFTRTSRIATRDGKPRELEISLNCDEDVHRRSHTEDAEINDFEELLLEILCEKLKDPII
ncbi:uncharacterized protein BDZ99DRAFT_518815 [Mytilinidion resinicola]|uniref:Uncharacterized protein n=1 Tax=Mytilinidion resinicola TaxID=574789 RepID=A0A6A6YUB6_9PEZI|nr:uncharacterized protein BDZ99DRAFT_518815 [Mytilinidion resinicola]KAF2811555.1 hypothetical protein BDZ99DRAFT_518815 [Mytilinidion resinicola]